MGYEFIFAEFSGNQCYFTSLINYQVIFHKLYVNTFSNFSVLSCHKNLRIVCCGMGGEALKASTELTEEDNKV